MNCFLVDRQNLVQAVNGRAAALHEEQWIATWVWSCATKQWKERKNLLAHLLPDYGSLDDFSASASASSHRRCLNAAMRCRCDAHIVRVRRQRARARRSERPGLRSFWMICRAATEVDRDYVLFFAGRRPLDVVSCVSCSHR